MTPAELRHLAPPPTAQVASGVIFRLVAGAVLLLLLSRMWGTGAKIGWWLNSIYIAVQLVIGLFVALAMTAAAKSPYEKALAAQRLAIARFPFWPVVLGSELLGWVLIGRWLHVGV